MPQSLSMTERLYYSDSFLREFDAVVVSSEPAPGASGEQRFHVVLDRTAFYPTSGGQPHDTGKLSLASVLDVFERDDGTIVHHTDMPFTPGRTHAAIDWPRRFDHMQQHTGQHLLSAVFIELQNWPTVSFHLGRDVSTIDLAAPAISLAQLEKVELRANEIISDDRPVAIRLCTAAELASLGVRKAVERDGPIRVLEIESYDRQPCGGTHVARTGQIGSLLLRKCEKVKQNWRVEFVCGTRAVRAARADQTLLAESARLLSCGQPELPAMLQRALEERQTSHRARQRLVEYLAGVEALLLLATELRPGKPGTPRVVQRIFDEADPDYLRLLASKLAAEAKVQVLLGSRSGGHIVFAQSAGLHADMNALLKECLAGAGKGGGTCDFAQGSVADLSALSSILSRALDRLRS